MTKKLTYILILKVYGQSSIELHDDQQQMEEKQDQTTQ